MNKNKKIIEKVKTAVIITLIISMFIFGWYSNLFDEFFNRVPVFGTIGNLTGAMPSDDFSGMLEMEAARPLGIIITHDDGRRLGVRYNTELRNVIYDWTAGIVGEALGSMSEPIRVNQAEWRHAITSPGVFFEYINPIGLSILNAWLGAGIFHLEEEIYVRRIFVSFGDDRNKLFFKNAKSGDLYSAETASFARKAPELETLQTNDALFAFETGIAASEFAPYMIIIPDVLHPNVVVMSAGTAEELLNYVRNAFGHGREPERRYQDGDTLVSVGAHFNIRVEADGRVLYRRTDGYPSIDSEYTATLVEHIEKARLVVSSTIGRTAGSADAFFQSAFAYDERRTYITFGYYIAGGRVRLPDEMYAARFVFLAGHIIEAELLFLSYSIAEESTRLLPELMTLAAAGGEFMLVFAESEADVLMPAWSKVAER